MRNLRSKGFTLLELLIAIAIVAILAAVAIPSYLHYMTKSHMSEVVSAADRYKVAVAECLEQNAGTATSCDAGSDGIPAAITSGAGNINTVAVADGVITATPRAQNGLAASDTYILTPTWSSTNGTSWAATGGACTNDLVNC
ncbi:MAG: prepilin-type N-terminal cleavage/methylation domain-containing protein [Coxiellaceae bacterium]|nr:prepilin-type N-terminal cleavage/methylation domain-containing protein [Coxiellaceae bacterium]